MSGERRYCQSCGMPLSKDPKGGGSEADGTLSARYCSHCYAGGKFTAPDMTVDQMKDRVQEKLKEMGFPRFLASIFTRNISKLERWSSTERDGGS